MIIEKLIAITDAIEPNRTDITEIFSATVYPKKVTEGDLFIGNDIDDIKLALENGADVIMSEDTQDIPQDKLFLKVENIENSALRIISYMVKNDPDMYFYLLKPHTLSFTKMILADKKNIEYIPDDWKKAFEMILNSNKTIFLSDNEEFLKKIKPDIKTYKKTAHGYNVEDTLFRSTFRVEKYIYQHKQLVPFHLEFLLQAVELCNEQKLRYKIDNISYTKHFKPVFIEKETEIQSTHKNDHVVIVCDNLEDINEGRIYAKMTKVVMSKSIVFTPPKVKVEGYQNPTRFRDPVSLVTAVKTTSFHYGFVYSHDKEDYEALRDYFKEPL